MSQPFAVGRTITPLRFRHCKRWLYIMKEKQISRGIYKRKGVVHWTDFPRDIKSHLHFESTYIFPPRSSLLDLNYNFFIRFSCRLGTKPRSCFLKVSRLTSTYALLFSFFEVQRVSTRSHVLVVQFFFFIFFWNHLCTNIFVTRHHIPTTPLKHHSNILWQRNYQLSHITNSVLFLEIFFFKKKKSSKGNEFGILRCIRIPRKYNVLLSIIKNRRGVSYFMLKTKRMRRKHTRVGRPFSR